MILDDPRIRQPGRLHGLARLDAAIDAALGPDRGDDSDGAGGDGAVHATAAVPTAPVAGSGELDDLVTLRFVNRSTYDSRAEVVDEMRVSRASAHRVVQWFGGYCAGDDYDVLVDGEIVETDLNGEIQPLA